MASPYHSKSGPLKTWESHFPLIWVMELSIISAYFGKGNFFPENSSPTNLVEIQS